MLLLLFLQFSGSTGFSWCFLLPLAALVLAFGCSVEFFSAFGHLLLFCIFRAGASGVLAFRSSL